MKFIEIPLSGAYIIEIEPAFDERGFFARTFCKNEFKNKGLNPNIAQQSISYNKRKGTIRGMHYQNAPYQEVKIVSCIKGEIFDVIVDLRKDSPTYCQWFSILLSDENYKMLYIPKWFAHGFQTLKDDTIVLYQMSEFYYSEYQRGVRWDDPAFKIKWPFPPSVISERDKGYPLYGA
ncbi:MAG: dTDP-4-dehydrorhamnose 3,5-epimerase [bacterium]